MAWARHWVDVAQAEGRAGDTLIQLEADRTAAHDALKHQRSGSAASATQLAPRQNDYNFVLAELTVFETRGRLVSLNSCLVINQRGGSTTLESLLPNRQF
jgi:hypothetical protein